MVKKKLDANWSDIQMLFEYQTAGPFEYWTNGLHLVSYNWSGIQMGALVHRTLHLDLPFEI